MKALDPALHQVVTTKYKACILTNIVESIAENFNTAILRS